MIVVLNRITSIRPYDVWGACGFRRFQTDERDVNHDALWGPLTGVI